MASVPPKTYTAAGIALRTEDRANHVAEKARQMAYNNHWEAVLDRLRTKFLDERVFLYVTAPLADKLKLMNGQYSDLCGLATSFEECRKLAAAAIAAERDADHWAKVEAALKRDPIVEPTRENTVSIEADDHIYWFMFWPLTQVEDGIRQKAAA